MPATISLELKPSLRVPALLFLIHLLAGGAVWLSDLHWLIQCALTILILWHILFLWRERARTPIHISYRHQAPHQWLVKTAHSDWKVASLSSRTRYWRFYILLALRLRHNRRIIYLPIFPGDLSSEHFRQLLVLLRFSV